MDTQIKEKIQSIINVWETGSKTGDYGNVSIYHDGPNEVRQITYGRSQTSETGNLKALIEMYISANSIHSEEFKPYLNRIGVSSLVDNRKFIELLKKSANDPVMVRVQDEFFDKLYWDPAQKWFTENGFTLPLSMLVVFDSYIQSGCILKFLRNRFKEPVPNNGGNEKKWIKSYLEVRDYWLANHSLRPILHKTVYRTRDMLREIQLENWMLDKDFIANGIKIEGKSL